MTQALFETLENTLQKGENLSITLSRTEEGTLMFSVQPVLKEITGKLSDEAMQARASLSLPLVLKMTGKQADEQFIELLNGYGEARSSLQEGYERLIESIDEAAKTANKSSHPKTSTTKKVSSEADDASKTESTEQDSHSDIQGGGSDDKNPDSLI